MFTENTVGSAESLQQNELLRNASCRTATDNGDEAERNIAPDAAGYRAYFRPVFWPLPFERYASRQHGRAGEFIVRLRREVP